MRHTSALNPSDTITHSTLRRAAAVMLNSRPRWWNVKEVDPNRNEHANVKGDPKPDTRRHGGETFMHRGTQQT